jgi:5,10-methylenetetrahydrofolate reductase
LGCGLQQALQHSQGRRTRQGGLRLKLGEAAKYRRLLTVELIPDRAILTDLLSLKGRIDAITIPALRNGNGDTSYPTSFNVSPQQRSIASALIVKRTGIEAVPSLTCRDCQEADLAKISGFIEDGLENLLVVYGDSFADSQRDKYYFSRADQLIHRVALAGNGKRPSIGAVTNQYALNQEREISKTLARVEAGADFVLTNISFDQETVLNHRDDLLSAGLHVPLLVQVSIPHSLENVRFVSHKFGIPVPERVAKRLADGSPATGIELAAETFEALRREASGIHFSYLFRKRNPVPAYRALLEKIRAETIVVPALLGPVSRVGT